MKTMTAPRINASTGSTHTIPVTPSNFGFSNTNCPYDSSKYLRICSSVYPRARSSRTWPFMFTAISAGESETAMP